jgi:hypothetical protein
MLITSSTVDVDRDIPNAPKLLSTKEVTNALFMSITPVEFDNN